VLTGIATFLARAVAYLPAAVALNEYPMLLTMPELGWVHGCAHNLQVYIRWTVPRGLPGLQSIGQLLPELLLKELLPELLQALRNALILIFSTPLRLSMPTLRALQLVLPMMMVPGLQWLALLGLLLPLLPGLSSRHSFVSVLIRHLWSQLPGLSIPELFQLEILVLPLFLPELLPERAAVSRLLPVSPALYRPFLSRWSVRDRDHLCWRGRHGRLSREGEAALS
jgi:hypothetical protein